MAKIKKTNSTNVQNFLEILSYPIISKNEKYDTNFSKNLITSSSFKIDSISKDSDGNVTNLNLKRYNNGEEKLPYIKKYNIVFFKNEPDAYTAFQRKEVDLLSGIPGNTLSKIKDDRNFKFDVSQLPNNFAIFFNQNQSEVLRDGDLRQALSDVIDRTSLTNQVLGSFGIPMKNLAGDNPNSKSVDDIIKSLPSSFSFENGVLYYGIKKTENSKSANSTSDKNNKSTTKKTDTAETKTTNKTQVKIKLTTIQNEELVETAKFLANSWKKIGVETEIKIIDRKDLNQLVKERDFEGLLFGFSIKTVSDYYSFFNSKERSFPKLNISNYTNSSVDKILENLNNERKTANQKELIKQLSDIISKDNPVIILYKPQFVLAHFLKTQIQLPNTIKSEEDRYSYINNWFTDTEKVLSIFSKFNFINKIDMLLY